VTEVTTRYVAFIRNVMIGRASLHRDVLLRVFTDAGAIDPTSHLATGNVSFGWDGRVMSDFIDATQDGIASTKGRFEPVFVRSISGLRNSVKAQPFRCTPIWWRSWHRLSHSTTRRILILA
jgi:uncharacterized protein (DUF1697 family)